MIRRQARSAIVVRGARQNNLKSIDVDFPHGRLSVVTGVSGSGKSSLALDTLYAEGQRRYVTSLSTYAQQFLERLPRPDVDLVEGIPPAIAIEQANPVVNRRSTVGTATEVYDVLRLLFARAGNPHCARCGAPVRSWTATAAADALLRGQDGSAWYVTFALPVSQALTHEVLVENLRALGYLRLLAAGRETHLDEIDAARADLTRRTPLFVVVDRVTSETPRPRVVEAFERAYAEGEGEAFVFARGATDPGEGRGFSRHHRCDACRTPFPALRPTLFSFNNPYGACPACGGFGNLLEFDPDLVVRDPARSLGEGALDPWTKPRYTHRRERLRAFARATRIPWDAPWRELPAAARRALLHGGTYRGVRFGGMIPYLEDLTAKKYKAYVRFFLRQYQSYRECPECSGSRLRREAARVEVAGAALPDVVGWPLPRVAEWAEALLEGAGADRAEVVQPIARELRRRVAILIDVGLDYLTLDRLTRSLSGGEAQRIAIANALGTPLTAGLYVLDEPTVGLHVRDTARMVGLLGELADRGNTVVVVEHDLDVVRAADHVVELGPRSGSEGGRVVFAGSPGALEGAATTTGRWLRGEASLPMHSRARAARGWLVVRGAREHNLKAIDVAFPVGVTTAVTGVSGSGKSTLVHDIVVRALERRFAARTGASGDGRRQETSRRDPVGAHDAIEGVERLAGVVLVDQSPIGKSPRSNPVTYVSAFDPIRRLFADAPGARRRGFGPGHFSFNTADGRCPECQGDGHQRIEMHFLPDVFVTCETCRGRRYRPEVLAVRWRGKTIADVLSMTVSEAIAFFEGQPAASRGLRVLQSVGLGYLALGQPATAMSGGEAQRLKIARELARRPTRSKLSRGASGASRGKSARGTLYVLDEPTTGLHHADVRALVRVLDELVDRGDTVILVEHHLDVIARADWVVDLGPEGGERGGFVVAAGPPHEIALHAASHTGRALRERRVTREAALV